ncbi:hypothetical protein BC941DRAFT_512093 [Chlamydoabsidia padenii]|nr:hypothetical protein BC941DRAFT_512093 [Chlamydoabsidia padenii]
MILIIKVYAPSLSLICGVSLIRPSLFAVAGRRRHRVLFHTWICYRMGCAATSYGAPFDSWGWIMMYNAYGYFIAYLLALWLGFLPRLLSLVFRDLSLFLVQSFDFCWLFHTWFM